MLGSWFSHTNPLLNGYGFVKGILECWDPHVLQFDLLDQLPFLVGILKSWAAVWILKSWAPDSLHIHPSANWPGGIQVAV